MFRIFFKKSPAIEPHPHALDINFGHASIPIAFLQKLIPIGELPVEKLQTLKISLRNFKPGDMIFTRGEQAEELTYLRQGEVFLEAGNGAGYTVDSATFKACYPLSAGKEHKFSAFAKTFASIIYLPLCTLLNAPPQLNAPLISPKDEPEDLRKHLFYQGICAAYRKNELHAPSLPDVALRLRMALQKEIDIADAVKIVNLDPIISSKLIQVVNSPLYRPLTPVVNIYGAINRLGLQTTQNLATSISLNNLFVSVDKQLNEKIRSIWRDSIHVASLSYALASISGRINADEALLAGLIHNIGVLPIIAFAETFNKTAYTSEVLEQTIAAINGMLGVSILNNWGFPTKLQQIPLQTANWFYYTSDELQLNDIVLLAIYHHQIGHMHNRKLPPLNTLPAYHKLGEAELTPDLSLQALHDAKQQIAEALNFFRA
jgi:HD-like signal output (HDOD) protein